jgi:hypothetical protein
MKCSIVENDIDNSKPPHYTARSGIVNIIRIIIQEPKDGKL